MSDELLIPEADIAMAARKIVQAGRRTKRGKSRSNAKPVISTERKATVLSDELLIPEADIAMAARKIVQAGRRTKRGNTGPTLTLGTIKAVHDYDGNMVADVTVRGADLLGLDMTVDCVNAQPGDRCVIQEQAHHAMVTGILAKPGAWVPVTQADLLGLDMTVDCVNAQPGDRCVIQEQAHHAMVTGILAKPGAWVPVTQTIPITLISNGTVTITGVKAGSVVELRVECRSAVSGSWDSGTFGTLPSGWRPCQRVIACWSGRDGESQRQVYVETNGKMTYSNRGSGQNTGGWNLTLTYIVP